MRDSSLQIYVLISDTAITRARVNVFIAETNTDKSRPMFNYFRKRCVVDYANKDKAEGLSDVRVFGAMNTLKIGRIEVNTIFKMQRESDKEDGM